MSPRVALPIRPSRLATLAALAALLLSPVARAGEFHYVIVFAFQAEPNLPRFSHTFAVFVRAHGEGPRLECCRLETHTISWYPAQEGPRVARLVPCRGVNLSLAATLEQARRLGATAYRWGPYQIRRELYGLALVQEARLRSGRLGYKVLDAQQRPGRAFNCIHAASDIDTGPGLLDTGLSYGVPASRLVAGHYRRWMVNTHLSHEWVAARLGLRMPPAAY